MLFQRWRRTGSPPLRASVALLVLAMALAGGRALAVSGPQPAVNVSLSLTVPTFIEMVLNSSDISFPATAPGSTSPASTGFPLQVNITDNTNANTNVTLRGDGDFNQSGSNATFNMTNLTYSNLSAGGVNKSTVSTYNSSDPFPDWVNRPIPAPGTNVTVSLYFWLRIPAGQEAGAYNSNVTIRASQA